MKTRFSTIDIRATIGEIEQKYLGMRVVNVYDIDNKTYLVKLAKPDMKATLLMESGTRLHSTEFEWPKNITPSGFSMKLRKHLRGRRLEKVEQLGVDRIVDLQFGSSEAAYHIILEMYDRGNMLLTDYEYTILNLLRPRTDDSQDVKFAVREKYPLETAKQAEGAPTEERLRSIFEAAKEGDNLKKILNPQLIYGPAVIESSLIEAGFVGNARLGKEFHIEKDLPQLVSALQKAETLVRDIGSHNKGYILQKAEKMASGTEELLTYSEFHPHLYKQHEGIPHLEFDGFCKAVDEFFSQIGSQKLDMKAVQQEKQALKKLENVKKDHEKRLAELHREQELDKRRAHLIEINLQLVERAIKIVQSALANQIDWTEIGQIVKEAQAQGDPVAGAIKGLKLDQNHISMLLADPYDHDDSEEEEADPLSKELRKPLKVDIDLGLSAFANARRYYDMKRTAAKKETKTVESSGKALKSAERKTKQTLKEVQSTATINKARKTYWFEKFLWFISGENFLVIGGRDGQQNEFIVKRHLRPGDVYVHADLHGASSVIIKNPSGAPVPPKTLNEAGTMAVCNSAAWEAKVYTSAWWVYHNQVSKTAPTGEYLTTGSFMIRGKKNFLPPCYLVYGFGFLFKLDEDSVFRHKDERRIRMAEDDTESVAESDLTEVTEGSLDSLSSHSEDDESVNVEDIEEDLNDAEREVKAETSEGGAEGEDALSSSDSDSDEPAFPDTSIQLQHVKGDKFTLQRNVSTVSQASLDDDYVIELGDGVPIDLNPERPAKAGAKFSAKQRREFKKAQLKGVDPDKLEEMKGSMGDDQPADTNKETTLKPQQKQRQQLQQQKEQEQQTQQQQQQGRRQKKKQKKIKEKYADQDEEDRQLAMQLLASAGPQKEKKKDKKKDKKGKGRPQSATTETKNPGQGPQNKLQPGQHPHRRLTIDDLKVETVSLSEEGVTDVKPLKTAKIPVDADDEDDEEEKRAILEEENVRIAEDASIIDSLTGIPLPEEDGLLFALPVCAPYTALINYKHKVKLLPGTAKRGKAVKTAMNMFMHDKSVSVREKELLRSVKDGDLSRNMPGKVKLSAPNLHKHKKK